MLNYLRIALLSAWSAFVPWFVPLAYTAIGALQINGTSPHLLLIVSVIWAVIWTTILYFLDQTCYKLYQKYISKNNLSYDTKANTSKIYQWTQRLHKKLKVVEKKPTLFALVILTTISPIPDIVIIRYIQGKLPFTRFFVAVIIGKTLNYAPIIYGIELVKILV